jgi:hypothetical protein
MQIKNKLNLKRYAIGTIANISIVFLVFGSENLLVGLLFLTCVVLNQFILAVIVADATGIETNTSIVPVPLLAGLKLFLLIGAFYFAMSNTVGKELFLILIYIFQLINLVLSIKRVVKKIKDS